MLVDAGTRGGIGPQLHPLPVPELGMQVRPRPAHHPVLAAAAHVHLPGVPPHALAGQVPLVDVGDGRGVPVDPHPVGVHLETLRLQPRPRRRERLLGRVGTIGQGSGRSEVPLGEVGEELLCGRLRSGGFGGACHDAAGQCDGGCQDRQEPTRCLDEPDGRDRGADGSSSHRRHRRTGGTRDRGGDTARTERPLSPAEPCRRSRPAGSRSGRTPRERGD